MNYKSRQSDYIRYWLSRNELDFLPYFVQSKINNWSHTSKDEEHEEKEKKIPDILKKFIETEREELGINKEMKKDFRVCEEWLKHKSRKLILIKYYYKIKSYTKGSAYTKWFTLAPVIKITNMHIPIDTVTLYHILQKFLENNNILQKNTVLKNFTKRSAQKDEQSFWSTIFNVPEIQKMKAGKKKPEHKKSYFTFRIDTDGFAASIHFRKKDAVKKPTEKELDALELSKLQVVNPRVIAFDPGRTNLLYGVEVGKDNKIHKYILKKSTYYSGAGMNKESSYKKWKLETIREEERIFREFSLKGFYVETYKKFIKNYIKVYDKLWKTKSSKKWLAWKFRTYCLKNKFIDNFINSIMNDTPDKEMRKKENILVAYGDAKFSPSGKGERAGPTSWLSKRIAKRLNTVFVDEFNTTKKCHDCEHTLCAVNDRITNEEIARRKNKRLKKEKFEEVDEKEAKKLQTVEIRGLRWCSTSHTYKNRDLNAALNIRKLLLHKIEKKDINARPKYLSRGTKNPKRTPHLFSIEELKKKGQTSGAPENHPKTKSTTY
jgi:hypothetical protein